MSDEKFSSGMDMPLLLGILLGGLICLAVFALIGYGLYNNMANRVIQKNYVDVPNPFRAKIEKEQLTILDQTGATTDRLPIVDAKKALLALPAAEQAMPVTKADLDRHAAKEGAGN